MDLWKLKKSELQAQCKAKGEKTTGTKEDLIRRLQKYKAGRSQVSCAIVPRVIFNEKKSKKELIAKEKEETIFTAWKLPYDLSLGFDEKGNILSEFRAFLESEEYGKVFTFFGINFQELPDILRKMNHQLGKEYCYVHLDIDLILPLIMDFVSIKNTYTDRILNIKGVKSGTYIPIINEVKNEFQIRKLLECMRIGGTKIIIDITYEIFLQGRHAAMIYLDTQDKKGEYYDTSFSYKNSYNKLFVEAINIGLQELISPELRVNMQKMDCSNLQGKYGTCSAWTTFNAILRILNPELDEYSIVKVLSKYTPRTREVMIALFYYYFWLNFKDEGSYLLITQSEEFQSNYESYMLRSDFFPRLSKLKRFKPTKSSS